MPPISIIGLGDDGLAAAHSFADRLARSEHFIPLLAPELDIVVYAVVAESTDACSARARAVFEAAGARGLHLAMIELPVSFLSRASDDVVVNTETVTCLRSVLMKPEHKDWLDDIVAILEDCAELI